jgi:hypothetical protein
LALLLVVIPVLVCSLGIKKTMALRETYRNNQAAVENARISMASAQPRRQDGFAPGADVVGSGGVLNLIAADLAENGLRCERYTPYAVEKNSTAQVYAAQIVLSGAFIPLTKMVRSMEREGVPWQILSVEYESYIDGKTRARGLRMSVLILQISETGER